MAVYAIWIIFTHPRRVHVSDDEKPRLVSPTILEYPALCVTAVRAVSVLPNLFAPFLIYWLVLDSDRGIRAIVVDRDLLVVACLERILAYLLIRLVSHTHNHCTCMQSRLIR